jgi:hypothetical protein
MDFLNCPLFLPDVLTKLSRTLQTGKERMGQYVDQGPFLKKIFVSDKQDPV